MAQFIAYNSALSTTTGIAAGTSYATGAKVAIQLQIPDSSQIELVSWGISLDVAQATAALVEIASTDTGSTATTAHTATTVESMGQYATGMNSRLTYGATTNTGFGSGAITSNTTLRMADRAYVQQAYTMLWPLGERIWFGSAAAENFVQLRINTAATVNAICWLCWNEHI